MPKAFEACREAGGKIVTKKLRGDRYMYLCKDKDGNWHPGHVHTKEKKGE